MHQLILLCAVVTCAVCDCHVEEKSPDGHVTYRHGDSSLIIEVPHGGYLKPDEIPDRHNGCLNGGTCIYEHNCGDTSSDCRAVVSRDSYTKEIAEQLWDYIFAETNKRPHMIVNELHRSKLDANREINQATFGDPIATTAFQCYHEYIEKARSYIATNADCGRGLVIAMHGQIHPQNWTELGYRIRASSLDAGTIPNKRSSIRHLTESKCNRCSDSLACEYDIIRGEESLGGFLEAEGYKVVPSPTYPSPNGSSFFSGGENTMLYGSERLDGNTDAIQCEVPGTIRWNEEKREAFAKDFGAALLAFMGEYGFE